MGEVYITCYYDCISFIQTIHHTIAVCILQSGLYVVPFRLPVFEGKYDLFTRTQHYGALRYHKLFAQRAVHVYPHIHAAE